MNDNGWSADRMGELKVMIGGLQAEYDALRQRAMEAEATWIGLEWIVTTSRRSQRRCSVATVERLLPTEMADLVIESIEQTVVHVRSLKEGGTP